MLINGKQYNDLEMRVVADALKQLSKDFESGTGKTLLESMALDFEEEAKKYCTPPRCWPELEID